MVQVQYNVHGAQGYHMKVYLGARVQDRKHEGTPLP